ncbi:MAG: hypothetical protein PHU40_07205 [Sulfurimonas sp.]|nr:hypothetical protein [Sulfurimonas sp.]
MSDSRHSGLDPESHERFIDFLVPIVLDGKILCVLGKKHLKLMRLM